MHRILLPIALPPAAPEVIRQAAFLARHFRAELVVLHVLSPMTYPVGVLERGSALTDRDLHAPLILRAQQELDRSLGAGLEGINVRRLLLHGDAAHQIAQFTREEPVDLLVLSTNDPSGLYHRLLRSVAAKVLQAVDCPVWVGPTRHEPPSHEFRIRSILCSLDLQAHSVATLTHATRFAALFDARLTLVHVTSSAATYGPGGLHIDPRWKDELVRFAASELAGIQRQAGTDAEVIIDSGDVVTVLDRAAKQSDSDLLIMGRLPGRGHLGTNGSGYAIIRQSPLPVLSF
jgi:nucleotide-binding universal stress UspA family protein